jgi:hypothetical protein
MQRRPTCPAEPTYAITGLILISQSSHVRLALRGQLARKRENRPGGGLVKLYVRSRNCWHNSSPASHAIFDSFESCHL